MKRIKNKKRKTYYNLVCIILLLTIGFAAFATVLSLQGDFGILSTKMKVEWENANLTSGSVAGDVTIDPDTKTTASFTANFTKPGDYHEFTIDAVNKGNVDAIVDAITTNVYQDNSGVETAISKPSYINYSIKNSSDDSLVTQGQKIDKDSSVTYIIRVEMSKDINKEDLPTENTKLRFEFGINYSYKSSNNSNSHSDDNTSTSDYSTFEVVSRANDDSLTPGDIVKLGDEEFIVVSSDSTNTVLSARYGIVLEDYATMPGSVENTQFSSYDRAGSMAFSYDKYWVDESTLKQKYVNSSYSNNGKVYIYDSSYNGKPSFNFGPGSDGNPTPTSFDSNSSPLYSVAYYVEKYKNKLIEDGAVISKARLLTYDEAHIICENHLLDDDYNDGDMDYWTGSIDENDTDSIYVLSSSDYGYYEVGQQYLTNIYDPYGDSFFSDSHSTTYVGILPVLEVPTSSLN